MWNSIKIESHNENFKELAAGSGDNMADNELLLAMSELLDKKLKPVNDRLKKLRLHKRIIFCHVCKM